MNLMWNNQILHLNSLYCYQFSEFQFSKKVKELTPGPLPQVDILCHHQITKEYSPNNGLGTTPLHNSN